MPNPELKHKMILARVPLAIHNQIKEVAWSRGWNVTDVVRAGVCMFLDEIKENPDVGYKIDQLPLGRKKSYLQRDKDE
jgi:hypothetical protein